MSGAGPGDAEAAPSMNASISRMMSAVIAGKYKLVRLIGQGGMGAVYEGRNLTTTKRCAVKLRYRGRDEEHQVAIAASGLVPGKLKAAGPGARPAAGGKAGVVRAGAAKAPTAPAGKAPGTAKAPPSGKKPKPAVSTDTSEF